jgi:hypothetical protein
MKATVLAKALRVSIAAGRAPFIKGAPGIGKSALTKSIADEVGGFIDVRVPLLDPVDLRGLPSITGGITRWNVPEFLPREDTHGKRGILFFDEVSSAPRLVQVACYQLFLDRACGEYRIPDGWSVVCAGNRAIDRAVVERMSSALSNRLIHLTLDPDLEDWAKWAAASGVKPEVISFLRFRPELLHKMDDKRPDDPFPSPRSWEFASDLLKQAPDQETEHELLAGTVGDGTALEFEAFLQIARDLPNPDSIIANPNKGDVPKKPATLYAIVGALAHRATPKNFDKVLAYFQRLPTEYAVAGIKDALARDKALKEVKAYADWCRANYNVVLA